MKKSNEKTRPVKSSGFSGTVALTPVHKHSLNDALMHRTYQG
jgi:hypothetical protein